MRRAWKAKWALGFRYSDVGRYNAYVSMWPINVHIVRSMGFIGNVLKYHIKSLGGQIALPEIHNPIRCSKSQGLHQRRSSILPLTRGQWELIAMPFHVQPLATLFSYLTVSQMCLSFLRGTLARVPFSIINTMYTIFFSGWQILRHFGRDTGGDVSGGYTNWKKRLSWSLDSFKASARSVRRAWKAKGALGFEVLT